MFPKGLARRVLRLLRVHVARGGLAAHATGRQGRVRRAV